MACAISFETFKGGHGGTVLGLESLTIAGVVCEEFISGVAQTLWIIARGNLKETRSEICNVRLAQRGRGKGKKAQNHPL